MCASYLCLGKLGGRFCPVEMSFPHPCSSFIEIRKSSNRDYNPNLAGCQEKSGTNTHLYLSPNGKNRLQAGKIGVLAGGYGLKFINFYLLL